MIICHEIRLILSESLLPKILEHVWVDEKIYFSSSTRFTHSDSIFENLAPEKNQTLFSGITKCESDTGIASSYRLGSPAKFFRLNHCGKKYFRSQYCRQSFITTFEQSQSVFLAYHEFYRDIWRHLELLSILPSLLSKLRNSRRFRCFFDRPQRTLSLILLQIFPADMSNLALRTDRTRFG